MTSSRRSASSLRKRLLIVATGIFLVLALAYGVWWLLYAAHYESTDDAYVQGNLIPISAQIPGTIIAIGADETQTVPQGQQLITLDRSDTALALAQAEAALAQTVRHTRTLFVQNEALAADVAVREADITREAVALDRARKDLARRAALRRSGGVSGEELLHAQVAVKSAEAGLAQARAALAAAKAKLATNRALTDDSTAATHPDVLRAADQVRQAWLADHRTRVVAPVAGMVARRTAQLGQHIQAGAPLMTLVPLESLWVDANFKENQLRAMHPGQKATLVSDLYGDEVRYHGTVIGISAGSGGAFALLPAQNASGNWIKVVQRIPVRISLDPDVLRQHPLRVGMSMTVRVDLSSGPDDAEKHPMQAVRRDAPALATSVYDHPPAEVDARIQRIIQENLGS